MYSTDIPALPNLADANARAVSPMQAADVRTRTPLNMADVAAADSDLRARKKLRQMADAVPPVTDAEVMGAAIRRHAAISEHAAQSYPAAGAPAWFAPAMERILQPINRSLQQFNHVLVICTLLKFAFCHLLEC